MLLLDSVRTGTETGVGILRENLGPDLFRCRCARPTVHATRGIWSLLYNQLAQGLSWYRRFRCAKPSFRSELYPVQGDPYHVQWTYSDRDAFEDWDPGPDVMEVIDSSDRYSHIPAIRLRPGASRTFGKSEIVGAAPVHLRNTVDQILTTHLLFPDLYKVARKQDTAAV